MLQKASSLQPFTRDLRRRDSSSDPEAPPRRRVAHHESVPTRPQEPIDITNEIGSDDAEIEDQSFTPQPEPPSIHQHFTSLLQQFKDDDWAFLFRNHFTQGTTHWTSYYELPKSVHALVPPPAALMEGHAAVKGDLLRAFHVTCRTARWKKSFPTPRYKKGEWMVSGQNKEVSDLMQFMAPGQSRRLRHAVLDEVYPEWLMQRIWGTWTWNDLNSPSWVAPEESGAGQLCFDVVKVLRAVPSVGLRLDDQVPPDGHLPSHLVNLHRAWIKLLHERYPSHKQTRTQLVLWAPFTHLLYAKMTHVFENSSSSPGDVFEYLTPFCNGAVLGVALSSEFFRLENPFRVVHTEQAPSLMYLLNTLSYPLRTKDLHSVKVQVELGDMDMDKACREQLVPSEEEIFLFAVDEDHLHSCSKSLLIYATTCLCDRERDRFLAFNRPQLLERGLSRYLMNKRDHALPRVLIADWFRSRGCVSISGAYTSRPPTSVLNLMREMNPNSPEINARHHTGEDETFRPTRCQILHLVAGSTVLLKDQDICPICQEEMRANGKVVSLPGCGHTFHAHCMERALARSGRCPLDRKPIFAIPGVGYHFFRLHLAAKSCKVEMEVQDWYEHTEALKSMLRVNY